MTESSGTLLYRKTDSEWEVLIVRPSGAAARYGWSIPKGLPDAKESLEDAARRETFEETGVRPGALRYLGHIDYLKSRKRVHAFAGPAPSEAPTVNTWEIDAVRFVSLSEAEKLLHSDQRRLVPLLRKFLETE